MESVEIPPVLIRRLQGLGPRFIRVVKRGKLPFDKGWPENPMFADNPHLQKWLRNGGNYGVVCGDGLVVLDADTQEIKGMVKAMLPRTFTVETPNKGWHLYFRCELERSVRLRKGGMYVAELASKGRMVVGPGSVHPNGGRYRIIDESPLAAVSAEKLLEVLSLG